MMIDQITRELTFKQDIERVWTALTRPQEIKCWFGSDASFELQQGATGSFGWEGECEGSFAMRIERIEPPRYFAWRWMQQADTAFDENKSTLVEWHLTPLPEGGTRLVMTESGFAEAKQRQMNVEGWLQELGDLVQYLSCEVPA